MKLTLGSLFDGIAGFPLSASHYGITTKWASEIESFPIRISSKHFPGMKHLGDITKINGAAIEPVDIISFGSPCQDMSVAGKRAGLEGSRSGLFMEAVRIIREMREATNGVYPRISIWENVPGAFSSNNGNDFRAVLEEITEAEIPIPKSGRWAEAGLVRGNGRSMAWRVLDAQYWGVPQRRKRIFLVADFRGECAGEILFEREGMSGNSAESGEAREEIATDVGCGLEATSTTLSKKFKDMECEDLLPYCPTTPGDGVTKLLCEGCCCEEAYKNYLNEFTEASQGRRVFYESGPGWIGECKKAGCLRAEGENRPSRPTHTIVEPSRINCTPEGITGAVSSKWSKGTGGPAGDECYNLVCLSDTGGQWMNVGHNVAPTLRAEVHSHPPCVVIEDTVCQKEVTVDFGRTADRIRINASKSVTISASGGGSGAKTGLYLMPIAFNGRQDPVSGLVTGALDTCRPQAQCIAYPDPANTLLAKGNFSNRIDIDNVVAVDVRNLNETEELSGTLQSNGNDISAINPVRIGYRVRRLTPTECLRLQGMPDDWLDIEGASDSAKYKAVGNGVAKPCPDFIFSQIVKILGNEIFSKSKGEIVIGMDRE